jgi:hypothetical protein
MRVKFSGPAGQVNYEVGMEVGNPELEPGAIYDVSKELAARLLDSSAFFAKVNAKKTDDAESSDE